MCVCVCVCVCLYMQLKWKEPHLRVPIYENKRSQLEFLFKCNFCVAVRIKYLRLEVEIKKNNLFKIIFVYNNQL